jgi:hypothetical protein
MIGSDAAATTAEPIITDAREQPYKAMTAPHTFRSPPFMRSLPQAHRVVPTTTYPTIDREIPLIRRFFAKSSNFLMLLR